MSVSLEQIKKLRERTGISMTTCKNALEEADGDEELAIEILRKKGESKAAERADRATANGVVAVVLKDDKAAMISLACETDFVAKNADFIKKTEALAERMLSEGEDTDFSNEIADMNIQLGEKIEIKDRKVISGKKIGKYIHLNNRIGVVIATTGGDDELVKDLAMHIAASNPRTLSPDEIGADLIEKEKEIWRELLKTEGKPEAIWDKIMEGKEKKFREEFALLTQPFVKNPEKLIQDLLGGETVLSFHRFEV